MTPHPPTVRHEPADIRIGVMLITGLLIAAFLLFSAFLVEASVGHDGLLCELGYDKDGDGDGVTGCR